MLEVTGGERAISRKHQQQPHQQHQQQQLHHEQVDAGMASSVAGATHTAAGATHTAAGATHTDAAPAPAAAAAAAPLVSRRGAVDWPALYAGSGLAAANAAQADALNKACAAQQPPLQLSSMHAQPFW